MRELRQRRTVRYERMNRTPEDEPDSMPRLATQLFFFEISSDPFFSPYFKERERRRLKTKIRENNERGIQWRGECQETMELSSRRRRRPAA